MHSDPSKFTIFARDKDTPLKFEEFTTADTPVLSIRIISFTDATLLSISWPHTFSDAMGITAIFDAWTLVLNGKEAQVPPLTGFDYDPLAVFGSESRAKFVLADRQLKGLSMTLFGLRFILEPVWYPRDEARVLCIPAATLACIKSTELQDITVEGQTPFLSDSQQSSFFAFFLAT